jgi:hypothetical protein
MSNKLKHEVKALTYHEIGMRLDDQLDAAKSEQSGFEGAKQAFQLASKRVEDLTAHIDKEVKDGVMDIEQSTLAKRWILRAINVVSNLAMQSEVQFYQAQGKVVALTQAVKHTKNLYDQEKARLDEAIAHEKAMAEAEAKGETIEDPKRPISRPMGEHPGNPIADRREGEAETVEVVPEATVTRKRKKG